MKPNQPMSKFAAHEHVVISKIFVIRGQRVMLDEDLANMYGIETRRLNEQVRRNMDRFPKDFMFQLTNKEFDNLMSQNAISSWGGRRKNPLVFTEHGVLMLSSVLNTPTAIKVNIKIMRVYNKLRDLLSTHKDVLLKLDQLEKRMLKQEVKGKKHAEEIQLVFHTLKRLIEEPIPARKRIGFKAD